MEVTHLASRPHAWQGLVKKACSANHLAMEKGLGQRMASFLFGALVPSLPPAAEQQWPTPGLGSSFL